MTTCFLQPGRQRKNRGQRPGEIMIMSCRTRGIMYNRATFAAILQQARKKPLVTSLLPERSYTRGWRCESYYDQFLVFGQVILKRFHRQQKQQGGKWRWFLSKPIVSYNLITNYFPVRWLGHCHCYSLWPHYAGLRRGYSRMPASGLTNEESQVLAVPGFHYFHSFNCIFR